ncbi:SIS domain-containing protein [Terriglobus roseus]|uniref:Glutamine--fructose-6-phosphate aminotransferase [isomerizing] n=1 Tax=Terriglobus roseus TaxID=392734 RepID=A0A1H4JVA6_9BACT|nr:SIS domain-containing protein [Terriglobus roseus]SEB49785.1 glucosamine--fructose-6-phosphate aminotransferase (isomerizing) [Terriglobus roseus]
MSSEQMKGRIVAQPASLRRVLKHQYGAGADALQQAASLLRSAAQVVITGMGASYYAALPLESHLCAAGVNAVAVEAGELLHFRLRAYPDAVLLVVSRSGESIEIAKLLAAKSPGQTVIGVSNRPKSRLAREADVAIAMESQDDDIVALQTYTGTLLTLALLGRAVENASAAARTEVESFLPGFEDLVITSLDGLQGWDAFLRPCRSLYLLGRGASYASALEGALLFHEVSKEPAVAMPTASFRHGPVEVVDRGFRAFLFAPQDKTQKLNVALAQDLVRFGGQVRVIGPSEDTSGEMQWIATPSLLDIYAPIFEVVPLQAAALRLAELEGIVPGSFRFAPPVALDEASFGPVS